MLRSFCYSHVPVPIHMHSFIAAGRIQPHEERVALQSRCTEGCPWADIGSVIVHRTNGSTPDGLWHGVIQSSRSSYSSLSYSGMLIYSAHETRYKNVLRIRNLLRRPRRLQRGSDGRPRGPKMAPRRPKRVQQSSKGTTRTAQGWSIGPQGRSHERRTRGPAPSIGNCLPFRGR